MFEGSIFYLKGVQYLYNYLAKKKKKKRSCESKFPTLDRSTRCRAMLDRLNQQSSYYRVHKNSSFSELCLSFILDLKHNQLNITRHTVDTSCQYLICMDLTFVNINVYIRWCVYDVVCNNTYRKYKGSDTCTTPYAHDLYTLHKIHIYIYIYIYIYI